MSVEVVFATGLWKMEMLSMYKWYSINYIYKKGKTFFLKVHVFP